MKHDSVESMKPRLVTLDCDGQIGFFLEDLHSQHILVGDQN
jgi:hypothetical protein